MDNWAVFWTALGAVGQCIGAIGTIAVVIYALWQDPWKRPKLIITFDGELDVKSQPHGHAGSRWLRVRVQNEKRRKTAKNCQAFVIGIRQIAPNDVDRFPNDVRQLDWTHGTPTSRDLVSGVVHRVDVVA